MVFNNNIIVNNKIASSEILTEYCGLLTETRQINCMDSDRAYYQYNTIDNLWYEPKIDSLINNMYKAYNETSLEKQNRINHQSDRIQQFSIDNVSKYFLNL